MIGKVDKISVFPQLLTLPVISVEWPWLEEPLLFKTAIFSSSSSSCYSLKVIVGQTRDSAWSGLDLHLHWAGSGSNAFCSFCEEDQRRSIWRFFVNDSQLKNSESAFLKKEEKSMKKETKEEREEERKRKLPSAKKRSVATFLWMAFHVCRLRCQRKLLHTRGRVTSATWSGNWACSPFKFRHLPFERSSSSSSSSLAGFCKRKTIIMILFILIVWV